VNWKQTIAGLLIGASLVGAAYASEGISVAPDGAIMHEPLPPPPGTKDSIPVFVYDPQRLGGQPREFQRDGLAFPAPNVERRPAREEARYAKAGVESQAPAKTPSRSTGSGAWDPRGTLGDEALPDRNTQKEGTIGYHASFDPSVVPFKRNRVLDTVTESGSLSLRSRELREVPILGTQSLQDREIFWGTVLVRGRNGDTIPLPSVAANSRVLSMEVSPKLPLTILRDGADNLYVRPRFRGTEEQTARLVFLVDAPKRYFGQPVPKSATLADVPATHRPKLPRRLQAAAERVAKRLKLSGQTHYRPLLRAMVRHFRSFEPGEAPKDTGDLYTDLALGKRGICRHRSYAFVVTAHGLGIPARYVFNEAHVFVEVWIPGDHPGWMRIDLGGSAERLVVKGGEDKVRHNPEGSDPFERPAPYARDSRSGPSAGANTVIGLPPNQRRGTPRIESLAPVRAGLLPPPTPLEAVAGAATTTTSLSVLTPVVFRGEPFDIKGVVTRGDGAPSSGHVRLLLVDASSGHTIGLLQTVALSHTGTYETTLTIPGALSPGGYEVIAEYLGDDVSAPSTSP
jgi:hypothetical protein